jgi:pimeloyl-ACP methyl ester carboxylesterase
VAETPEPWSIDSALRTYGIARWGSGYFGVNPTGNITVRPQNTGGAEIDLLKVATRARERGLNYPLLIRFHDLLRHRVRAINEAFADAILALDDSMPNGTYIDMCSKLPVVDPLKIPVPTVVLRGQFDGIAGFDDLLQFFKLLPHPDKQFTVLNGISHASFQQKNYKMVYQILHAYFTQPEPAYTDYGSHAQ